MYLIMSYYCITINNFSMVYMYHDDNETSLIRQPQNPTLFSFLIECQIREVLLYIQNEVFLYTHNTQLQLKTWIPCLNCPSPPSISFKSLYSKIKHVHNNILCNFMWIAIPTRFVSSLYCFWLKHTYILYVHYNKSSCKHSTKYILIHV